MKNKFLICLSVVLISIGCKHEVIVTEDCTGVNPTYTSDIKSILDARCASSGCHNGASSAAGVVLDNYNDVVSESKKNKFMGSIRHSSGYNPMPVGGKLDDVSIKKIACWIQNGRPQ
jgi:hypothetical protein